MIAQNEKVPSFAAMTADIYTYMVSFDLRF